MDIIFKGRHTDVLERFRKHATGKLTKIERLAARAIRVDVEVSAERNPRQSGRKERVELTITSSGPAIRAEAAAEDRFAALDMALAKLESRLRRANDRRKGRHSAHAAVRLPDRPDAGGGEPAPAGPAVPGLIPAAGQGSPAAGNAGGDVVPIEMDGDGPLVVREKFHGARPMAIDQALLEMELVGHDFFLFRDVHGGVPSVVYRRRGYQYGVIRLVETTAGDQAGQAPPAGPAAGNGPAVRSSPAAGNGPAVRSGRVVPAGPAVGNGLVGSQAGRTARLGSG